MSIKVKHNTITNGISSSAFDYSKIKTIKAEHIIAFSETGKFAGWPANSGVWVWGNEILVGFTLGYQNPDYSSGPSIRNDMPRENAMLRSLDGGATWTLEIPENYAGSQNDKPELYKQSPGFNFEHPDFALKISGERFFISEDRGRKWEGPFKINFKVHNEPISVLTSRNDYIILSPFECFVFMSAENCMAESDYKDRCFCTRTTDGGKTFEFLGWMTHDVENRSVMSSSLRIGDNHLVSSVRRKHINFVNNIPSLFQNWIDAVESKDNGRTWITLGKVADTDFSENNGNPPAMVRLFDGRLCVVYGYRTSPYGIRMKVSKDNGKSWGEELVIRSDGATWELGYPRMVINQEGQLVIIYYYSIKEKFEKYIGVSILNQSDI